MILVFLFGWWFVFGLASLGEQRFAHCGVVSGLGAGGYYSVFRVWVFGFGLYGVCLY